VDKFKVILRGLRMGKADAGVKTAEDADPLKALSSLLAVKDYPEKEPLICWQDNEDAVKRLAALDVDYHGDRKPERHWIDAAARENPIAPACWWTTHGGGLRAVFVPHEGLTADELAAAFAVWFLFSPLAQRRSMLGGLTGVEIKTITRHPEYPNAVGNRCGGVHPGGLSRPKKLASALLDGEAEVDEDAVEEWLSENGYQQYTAYEHDRCPIDEYGEHTSHGKPVWVGDYGINCLSCASRGDGFRSWAALLDPGRVTRKKNVVHAMVRGRTHYDHARHVLAVEWEGEKCPEAVRKLAYRALLKIKHVLPVDKQKPKVKEAEQALVDRVFYSQKLVRGEGRWMDLADLATVYEGQPLAKMLTDIPALQAVNQTNGRPSFRTGKHGNFLTSADLRDDGFPAIVPLIGCDLRGKMPETFGAEPVYAALVPDRRAPFKYIPKDQRDIKKAEAVFRGQFPGADLNLIRLLIAAKGYAQRMPMEPPLIVLTGQSGAGKTATVLLAAEVACDRMSRVSFKRELNEFHRMLGAAAGRCGFLLIDEIAKATAWESEMEECLTNIQSGISYRPLYSASAKLGNLPSVVLADTDLPPVMRKSIQIARRVVHVELGAGGTLDADGEAVDWRITTYGGDIRGWRGRLNHSAAADCLVSEVLDELMIYNTFHEAAAKLGYRTLDKAGTEDVDPDTDLIAFYVAVCTAPETRNATFKGGGWKVFDPLDGTGPLADAWRNCTETGTPQRLTGCQWAKLLKVPGVVLNFRALSRKMVGVRFSAGGIRSSTVKYNGDIRPDLIPEKPSDVLPLPGVNSEPAAVPPLAGVAG
jgi:hypothetical protein